jgi:hypothetical protein
MNSNTNITASAEKCPFPETCILSERISRIGFTVTLYEYSSAMQRFDVRTRPPVHKISTLLYPLFLFYNFFNTLYLRGILSTAPVHLYLGLPTAYLITRLHYIYSYIYLYTV